MIPFAEFGAFVCEALCARVDCDPVLSVVGVVTDPELDAVDDLEVDTTDELEVEIADEPVVDAAAPVGAAIPLAPRVKPQVGAAGPVTLDHISITHSMAIFWSTHVVPVSVGARSRM